MQATAANKIVLLASLAMMEALAVNVMAAPPGAPQQNQPHQTVTQSLTTGAARLDLRAPSRTIVGDEKSLAFPSAIVHRPFGSAADTAQLSNVGMANQQIRPPIVELARHIQHEGLPLARLWENKSALVHIGLNQRGKPGLWLVQKIH